MKKLTLLTLVFVFLVSDAIGQERPPWLARVDDTIRLKEAAWKAGERLVNDQGGSYTEGTRFTKGGVTGLVQITSYSVLTNPQETFGGCVIANDNIKRHGKKVKLLGLGDEAYLWPGPKPHDFAEVLFRKGRTFVIVFLPGRVTAERFARHVASHIP